MKQQANDILYRCKSSINSLAIYALEKELSSDLIAQEIDKRFSDIEFELKDKIMKDVIQSCYKLVWEVDVPKINSIAPNELNDCMYVIPSTKIMFLVSSIAETLKSFHISLQQKKSIPEEFFTSCVEHLLHSPMGHYDHELLMIYCKQTTIILKTAGLQTKESINLLQPEELYKCLFYTFWNKCNWKKLFPSGGHISNYIKNNRQLLLDIILSLKKPMRVDLIAKTYFDFIGIGKAHDLFLISLLDFSVLTWLMFFGVIDYVNDSYDKPVTIACTNVAHQLVQFLLI